MLLRSIIALSLLGGVQSYCIHHEATNGTKKCFQGCAPAAFNATGLDHSDVCPVEYNTLDSSDVVLQCPDGVSNLKYCVGHEVNVTFQTRGYAGFCFFNEGDKHCYEACSYTKFSMNGFSTAGFCPKMYNHEEKAYSVEQCPDGKTNVKYCEDTKIKVTLRTVGIQ